MRIVHRPSSCFECAIGWRKHNLIVILLNLGIFWGQFWTFCLFSWLTVNTLNPCYQIPLSSFSWLPLKDSLFNYRAIYAARCNLSARCHSLCLLFDYISTKAHLIYALPNLHLSWTSSYSNEGLTPLLFHQNILWLRRRVNHLSKW